MLTYRQAASNEEEAEIARLSKELLAAYVREDESLRVHVIESKQDDEAIELPAGAVALLLEILDAMAAGRGIRLLAESAELSTAEAADILNVSRPYLVKLLDEGLIPHHKVGKHRRIRMEDVMHYKQGFEREREAILEQLVADAQEQDMGYD